MINPALGMILQELFFEADMLGYKIPNSIKRISSADFPTAAVRPAYSVLDCSKIEKNFGVTTSNWRDGLKMAMGKLQDTV